MNTLEQVQNSLEADHLALRRFLEQFGSGDGFPLLFGQLVSFTVKASGVQALAFHSLKRAYIGGFVCSSTGFGYADAVVVVAPDVVQLYGLADPTKQVMIRTSNTINVDTTFKAWVF